MSNKETPKKTIEQIALNLLQKNKSYNNMLSEYFIKISEDNPNIIETNKEKDEKEETVKDRIYIAKIICEKFSEKNSKNNLNIKQDTNTTKKKSNENLKLCTTVNGSLTDYYYCCKKNIGRNSSLIEEENEKNNNEDNPSLILNNNKENNNIKQNNKDIKINDDNLYIIKYISNFELIPNEKINLDDFNKLLKIYKYLLNNFNFNDNIDIIQLISIEFIKFIFQGKINIILFYFNFSIDIIKFLFYQIFIFLNLLYLDELKDLNESFEMSFKTIFLYSSQNFQMILDIVLNPSFYVNQEKKITKCFFGRNKIIYSILKTIAPKKTSLNSSLNNNININNNSSNTENNNLFNSNEDNINLYSTTYKLIEEIESDTKINRTLEKRNNIYNKFEKHIINLKSCEYLLNKIKLIENKISNKENDNIINIDSILNEINLDEDIINNNINNVNNLNPGKKILTLPIPIRDSKEFNFRYTLFIELDETLVHYYEEGENYFVKVRQGTDEFLKTLQEFCEILIVSTSNKEYTDIILENLNKEKNYVERAIYKELCDNDNIEIDFKKINRDLNKCIFICHEGKTFFNAPESNIIELKEFNGEEEDKEIVYLQNELIKLKNGNENVINIIKDIKNIIQKKRKEQGENIS